MFRAMLYTQWKWSRLIVVLGSVAGFALPIDRKSTRLNVTVKSRMPSSA